jgi:K+ transporter
MPSFTFILPTASNILKLLPLIVRTLVIVIMIQYTCFAMHLKSKGEGGTIGFYRRLDCTPYIRFY